MWGAVPKTGLVVPILLLVMAGGALGRIIYVDADAIGANNGSSWSDAYIYLQDALADANLSGDVNQMRVAQGIYRPDQNSVYPDGTGVREATFQLINGVSLKGGYAGFGEPDPNERNIQLYETVLSGDLNGDDGPDFDDYDENSYHVVTGSGTDGNAVLDGFTITAGNADGYDLAELGAGMYNDGGSPTVMDCNFTWNMAGSGGGVSNCGGSNPKMVRCRFVSNTAENYGGGIYNYKSSPVLINCAFSDNSCCGFGYCFWVCMGAAVCNIESDCTIINCTFEGNWLNSMYSNRGGGVYSYKGELTLENCTFSENRAVSVFGTGFDTDHAGGGVYSLGVADGRVVDCTFVGNLAHAGGGIFNNSENLKVTKCTFMENSAKHFDGGAVHSGRNATFSDCSFINNSANRDGGGVYNRYGSNTFSDCSFINNSANRDGGGVYNRYGSNLILTNCAFADNLAGASGGGLYDNRSRGTEVINCMFSANWANSGGGIFNDSENVKVTKCTFMENVAEDFDGGAVYNSGSATFSYCSFMNNSAEGDGGGMCNSYGTDLILTNCAFCDNLAGASGGGFCDYKSRGTEVINCIFSGNSATGAGGGMYNESHIPNLVNCTFWGNSAVSSGGAMYNKYTYGGISARLTNCILRGDAPDEIGLYYSYMGRPLITYCDVEGGWRGEGNIDADPCFVNPDGNDYHLRPESFCIDIGDNSSIPPDTTDLDADGNTAEPIPWDLDGNPRIADGNSDCRSVVDMGAYEYFVPPIEVAMKFTPQSLNLGSKGKWVKAHCVLPEGYTVEDVDVNMPATLELLGIEVQSEYIDAFVNEDDLVEVEIAFERGVFCGVGTSDEFAEATVTGSLTCSRRFHGTDTIKIVSNKFTCIAAFASYWLEEDCGKPDWCGGADVNQDSIVNFFDFGLFDPPMACCIEILTQ